MKSDWQLKKLSEILEISPREGLSKGKIAKKVSMDKLIPYTKKINGYELEPFKSGSKFKNGDTLMARITPCLENGKTSYVSILEDGEVGFGSTEFFVLRAKREISDSQFIYYLAISDDIRKVAIQSMTGTSGRQRAQKEAILNYEMMIPPLYKQRGIANILGNLDSKIALNNQKIATLEELVATLFKRWFVDFEFPDENGISYKSGGGKLVESELGKIPCDFKVQPLSDLIEIIDNRGKTPPLVTDCYDYPIIDVKALGGASRVIDYDNCRKFVSVETYENWFRKGHPEKYDILLSTVGSIGEMKLFYFSKGCIAQNVVAFRSNSISKLYLYDYMQSIKKDLVTFNIGSVQPSIKVTHIIKKKILLPSEEVLARYDKLVQPITEQIFSLSKEIEDLILIRDSLLPKLLSGEIEIPIVEEDIN